MAVGGAQLVRIVVNGESRGIPRGLSVLGLVESLGLAPERVAVELDRDILPKTQWADASLTGGERLEIVSFVGGG